MVFIMKIIILPSCSLSHYFIKYKFHLHEVVYHLEKGNVYIQLKNQMSNKYRELISLHLL